jgi:hypothetical protein
MKKVWVLTGLGAAMFAHCGTSEAQEPSRVDGVQMHRACFTPSDNCTQPIEAVSSSAGVPVHAYIDPRPLLTMRDVITWSPCQLDNTEVCIFLSDDDLRQWNTLYSAGKNVRIAFVLDDRVLATVISRGPARNPIRLLQSDGASPPVALEQFLRSHSGK